MKLLEGVTPYTLFTQAVAQQASQDFLDALYQFMRSSSAFKDSLPLKSALISDALMTLQITQDKHNGADWRTATFYVKGAYGKHLQLYENQFKAWVPFDSGYAEARTQMERSALFLHFFREQQGVISALHHFDQQFEVVLLSYITDCAVRV